MIPLLLITLEICFVFLIIILLYRLKEHYGLPLLYIFIGSNQYLQTLLASTIYIKVFGDYLVSPGSMVLFSSSLLAILLIYLKEDVPQTRTLIYGIVLTNVTLAILSLFTNWQFGLKDSLNILNIPPGIFMVNIRLFLVGTGVLILDAIMIIVVYEFLFFKIKKLGLLGRILGTLLIVQYFDALVFIGGSFWEDENFKTVLVSQLAGKTYSSLLYGVLLYSYLRFVDQNRYLQQAVQPQVMKDVFTLLTYREKYELALKEKNSLDKELQQTMEQWQTMAENIPDYVIILDSEGKILFMNHPLASGNMEKALGQKIYDLLLPDYHPKARTALDEVFHQGQNQTCEVAMRGSFGKTDWYLSRVGPIKKDGRISSAICIMTNITDRKQAEEERKQLNEELVKKQRMAAIGETIEHISHSMKNVFTSMDVSIVLIRQAYEMKEWLKVEKGLTLLLSSSNHLNLLLANMLDYSKNRGPVFEEIDIPEIMKEILRMLEAVSGSKDIQLVSNIEPGAEKIYSDKMRLTRALMNLGTNAVDAIQYKGKIQFTFGRKNPREIILLNSQLDTPRGKEEEKVMIIEVRDDGAGITKEVLKDIFKPFFSTKGSRGTGLGLASVKQFMEEQGGDILVESTPGLGTIFLLIFWMNKPPAERETIKVN